MSEPRAAKHGGKRRFRLRARVVAMLIAGTAIIGWITLARYTDPQRIRLAAETYLQRFSNGRVRVGGAGLSWSGGIRLLDVTVASVEPPIADGISSESNAHIEPIFSCREVRLAPVWSSFLRGKMDIESIVAVEPTCTIVRDAALGTTNLSDQMRATWRSSGAAQLALPTMELRDARIRVLVRENHRDRPVDDLRLTVRGRPSRRDPRYYDVVWHGDGRRAAQGHSRVDLRTGRVDNVRGGLPWMSIEAVMIAVNAKYDAAGTWCDLLGLDGTVRARDYRLGGPSDPQGPRRVTIDLDDASISIPLDEQERALAPQERYLRFAQVRGTLELTADGIDAEFDALFHGASCSVTTSIRGSVEALATFDDVDVDFRLSVRDLKLPRLGDDAPLQETRFIERWPRLARFYYNYDPHGHVDLEIEAVKPAGPDQVVVAKRLVVTAKGGDAFCRLRPYRGYDLEGSVELNPEGVWIRGLRGRHGGGVVSVDGWMARPDRCAAVELTIKGDGLMADADLFAAIGPKYRLLRDLLRPRGTIDVAVELSRPACTDGLRGPWISRTTVTPNQLEASYSGFPYPVKDLSGKIVIDRGSVRIMNVRGRSGDASVVVRGEGTRDASGLSDLSINVDADDIPIDDVLLGSLPPRLRDPLSSFHAKGRVNLHLSLAFGAEGLLVSNETEVVLRDVSIRHDRFPVSIDEIQGRLSVLPSAIRFDGVSGRYGDAPLLANGTIGLSDSSVASRLALHCTGLRVDDPLRAAAPAGLRKVLDDWRVDGPMDAEITLKKAGNAEQESFELRVVARLDGVDVKHPRFPIPFRQVRGDITIDPNGVRGSGIQARYGTASVSVDFDTHRSETRDNGTLALTAIGVTLDHSLRDLLSPTMQTAWNRMGLAGRADLHFDRLNYQSTREGSFLEWSLDGYAELHNIEMSGIGEIRHLSGTLDVGGLLVDRLGGTALTGHVKLAVVDVLGRRLTRLTSPWSFARTAEGTGRFSMESLRGDVYDGSLTAELEILFANDRAEYNFTTKMHGVDIDSLINARNVDRALPTASTDVHGFLDARLHLIGVLGEPSSRRGGGRIEVVEGHIYRLPLLAAIFNVINLSMPTREAFDDMEATFFVMGNRVDIERLFLRGSALALVGSGSISLPDHGLNLDLVNVSPHAWARIPGLSGFVEGATRELVELHASGPLSQPTVTARPLRGVTEEMKRLFRKRKPRIAQLGAR